MPARRCASLHYVPTCRPTSDSIGVSRRSRPPVAPGSVRIECNGSVLLDHAYGRDGAGIAITPASSFQIGPVWKTFTTAGGPRAPAPGDRRLGTVSPALRAAMFAWQVSLSGPGSPLTELGYGSGWFIEEVGKREIVVHPGEGL